MRYLVALAAVLAVAACAPNPARMALTDQIDGDYQGKVRLVQGDPKVCLPSRYGVMEVGDRAIFLAYQPTVLFTAQIAPDGTIHAENAPYVMDGRIKNDNLYMTVSGAGCRSVFDLDFVWNHS